MMDLVIEKFLWALKSNIEPTDAQKEGAKRSQVALRVLLNQGKIGDRITSSFLSGSYSRDTAIRPIDDVDIICVINPKSWQTTTADVLYNVRPTPEAVLQTFANAIRYRYPVSSVYYQRRSVRLSLFHLDIDVVPAISLDAENRMILIPDSTQNDWLKSSPKTHGELATSINQAREGRLKPLIKLLKRWNGNIGEAAALKSFCIETMAIRIFREVNFTTLTDGLIYFWDFLTYLGGDAPNFRWTSSYGVSKGYFAVEVPDLAGTGSNTAAGITSEHFQNFTSYARRSRDRIFSAKRAQTASTAVQFVRDAMYT